MSMMVPTLTEDKVNLVSHLETQHVIEDVLDSKNCEMKKKHNHQGHPSSQCHRVMALVVFFASPQSHALKICLEIMIALPKSLKASSGTG